MKYRRGWGGTNGRDQTKYNMDKNDVSLLYSGGSGGFFALFVTLLTGQISCKFVDDFDLVTSVELNWHSLRRINRIYWKSTEQRQDYEGTLLIRDARRVFLHVNPTQEIIDSVRPTTRVCIYTDFVTQRTLARNKRAYWYWNKYSEEELAEVDAHLDIFARLAGRLMLYDYELVTDKAYNLITESDVAVKLQDIIKTDGDALLKPLGLTTNTAVIDFVQLYLSLHSDEERALLTK